MDYTDYYAVMDLPRTASQEDIKRAYRKLARKYHPDVSKEPNAEARFKEIGEAYAVLSDPEKRKLYDNLGSNWKAGQEFKPPPDWQENVHFSSGFNGFAEGGHGEQFSDFFESLFGSGFRKQRRQAHEFKQRGEDIHSRLSIPLEDAYHGATRTIQLPVTEVTPQGQLQQSTRTLNVKIPAGVKQGQQIRLINQGRPGHGSGPNGDLYLEIDFAPHRLFKIDSTDIYLTLPITPWEAALGATIPTPTLGGMVDLKIPAGAQSGQKLRLRGRGLPTRPPGDQYVVLQIMTPPANTDEARELYEQMIKVMPFNPRQQLGIQS